MSPQFIIAVALGGALGSVARYLVGIGSGRLFGTDFPWGTLINNVTGSFLRPGGVCRRPPGSF